MATDPRADVQRLLNHFKGRDAVLRTRIERLERELTTTTTTQDTMRVVRTVESAKEEYRAWFKVWVYLIHIKNMIKPSRIAGKLRELGLDALLAELKATAVATASPWRPPPPPPPARVPPPTLSRPVYNWTVDVDVGFVPRVRQRHSARAAVPRGRDKYRAHRTKGAKLRAQYKRARANKAPTLPANVPDESHEYRVSYEFVHTGAVRHGPWRKDKALVRTDVEYQNRACRGEIVHWMDQRATAPPAVEKKRPKSATKKGKW